VLILGRKEGDAILIGDNIKIVVIGCDRRGVRLGIEAPNNVAILRAEIVRDVTEENRRAEVDPTDVQAWVALIGGPRSAEP
jgi:carbon storage regulator